MKAKFVLIFALTLITATQALALPSKKQRPQGNGSSGMGNLHIDEDLSAKVISSQALTKKGDEIIDSLSGEKILKVDRIQRTELVKLYGEQLVNASLGSAKGFEYQPSRSGGAAGDQNLWIVCPNDGESCVRLTPLSRTNPKIPSLIGALFVPSK